MPHGWVLVMGSGETSQRQIAELQEFSSPGGAQAQHIPTSPYMPLCHHVSW